ncbi:hypothetical protein WJT74_10465 [Sphingomicrobium sp. XHP0239]|uniref:hypothetical protein n=1 Tax=Sphingomicrobium maritimum TaxID=3133972 RepID=UPI0031CC5349
MRLASLMIGAAALAFTVPASAQPGQGNGKGNGNAERGNGNGNGNARGAPGRGNGNADRGNRGNGNGNANRGNGGPPEARGNGRGNGNGNDRVRVQRADRGLAQARGNNGRGNGNGNGNNRGNATIVDRVVDRNVDRVIDRRVVDAPIFRYGSYGNDYRNDCPPGLAKKNNGCLPPGQARQLYGQRFEPRYAERDLFGAYRDWYGRDNDYRYRIGDDFLYRIGAGDIIDGLIPLYDRRGYYYPVGTRYPTAYDSYNLPYQYRDYYSDPSYRYGDGAIYRVNPETQIIQAVAALLTGDVAVGQRLPSAYSVYNVPQPYRARYSDSPENYYRYSDGYIYRVDPTTMLVSEIIEAIV